MQRLHCPRTAGHTPRPADGAVEDPQGRCMDACPVRPAILLQLFGAAAVLAVGLMLVAVGAMIIGVVLAVLGGAWFVRSLRRA